MNKSKGDIILYIIDKLISYKFNNVFIFILLKSTEIIF